MNSLPSRTAARFRVVAWGPLLACLLAAAAGVGSGWAQGTAAASTPGVINAIGAENEYANVLSQIGGAVRPRLLHPGQPEHRPAHVRGEPQRR